MNYLKTEIPDVIILEPKVVEDGRGFVMETFRENDCSSAGIIGPFVQENHSGSRQGVLRGLHYQIRQAQGKLVRVVAGEIFDVAVDLRRNASSFGHWEGRVLSSANKLQLWVPKGFAHGFYVLSEWADVVYKITDYYAPAWERCLLWNDPALGIDWPLEDRPAPTLSEKDALGKLLSDAEVYD